MLKHCLSTRAKALIMNRIELFQEDLEQHLLDKTNWPKLGLDPNKSLLLMGRPGVGKTYFIKQWIAHHGRAIHELSAYDIELKFKRSVDVSTPSFSFSDMLIDDLGIESTHVNIYGTVYYPLKQVLFERHREYLGSSKLLTHITTNLNIKQIRERYDERILDRLFEMCNFVVVTGTSYRAR